MRPRFSFPADELLDFASEINVKILRSGGKTLGVSFEVSGELLCPCEQDDAETGIPVSDESPADRAQRLLAFLLSDRNGGAA